jgi:uncharacterized protein (DUF427 family)
MAQTAKESVWDYPRPPRVEPVSKRVRVVFNGEVVADSGQSFRVLETSHPQVYYIPKQDIRMEFLQPSAWRTWCEFKGRASYWTLRVGDGVSEDCAWSYESPTPGYEAIQGYIAFYANRAGACYVDEERVKPQPGDFYGGWVTSGITGPFKGGPGTEGW